MNVAQRFFSSGLAFAALGAMAQISTPVFTPSAPVGAGSTTSATGGSALGTGAAAAPGNSATGTDTSGSNNNLQGPGQLRSPANRGQTGNPATSPAADGRQGAPGAASGPNAQNGPNARSGPNADARTDGRSDAKGDGKGPMDENQQVRAEQVKDATADEIEFQRFVRSATGQSLRLFGYELFAGPGRFESIQAAPVPSDYVLGPGDEIGVLINGITEFSERLTIDRDGRIFIPKIGPISLAGVALKDAEKVLTLNLGKTLRNFTVNVTMGRLRSIEVFVVGQARRPGKHLVSSVSSLINALFETGGPNANGSLRDIELRRGGKKLATIDMYAFLARGENASDVKLLSGDIIFIPAAGQRAALLGTINAPAIYEVKPGETVNQVLGLSGGLPTLAAPQKAQLERVDASREIARYVEDFALDAKGLGLVIKGGDIITVFQVSPQIANVVTLQGNVAAPLRYTFKPGMKVSDILEDRRLLIPGNYWLQINQGTSSGNYSKPEVNLDYATIQRLDPLTLRTQIVAFNLLKAIAKDPVENLELRSGDIVTVYRPDEAGQDTFNSITVTGDIIGGTRRFVWRPGFTVKDIIPSSQWLIDYYNYWVRAPGKSLRNDINWDYAQVLRRVPENLNTRAIAFNLGKAVMGKGAADNVVLEAGDQIALFTTAQLGVPIEKRTRIVTLSGEVKVPGQYQIEPGETLEKAIEKAGGLTRQAYLFGLEFKRDSVRVTQQENLDRLTQKLETQVLSEAQTRLQNVGSKEQGESVAASLRADQIRIENMRKLRATGRVALNLVPEKPVLPPLALDDQDVITVPSVPAFIGVFGAVLNENAILWKPGMSIGDAIQLAGLTAFAEESSAFVLRADGTVLQSGGARSWRFADWTTAGNLMPGDTVVVPEKSDRESTYTAFMRGLKDWTTVFYQFGLGAAAVKTLRN